MQHSHTGPSKLEQLLLSWLCRRPCLWWLRGPTRNQTYLHCLLELGGLELVERVHLLLHLDRRDGSWLAKHGAECCPPAALTFFLFSFWLTLNSSSFLASSLMLWASCKWARLTCSVSAVGSKTVKREADDVVAKNKQTKKTPKDGTYATWTSPGIFLMCFQDKTEQGYGGNSHVFNSVRTYSHTEGFRVT